MSSDNKISFVIHKYDLTGVGVFVSTSFMAYCATELLVDKFAQRVFPSMEESYKTVVKAACFAAVFQDYSVYPYLTMASFSAAIIFIEAIRKLYGPSKQAPCPPFLENLNAKYKGKPQTVFGNDRRIKILARGLIGIDKKNALMIGLPGIGKTKIVEGAAWQIANDKLEDKTSVFYGKTIYFLQLDQMMAGTGIVGTLETKIEELVAFVESRPDVIVFIDELHEILGAGKHRDSSTGSIAQKLKRHIIDGNWCIIGALTQQDYDLHLRSEPAIFRRYNQVDITEPAKDECLVILKSIIASEKFKVNYPGTEFTDEEILLVINMTNSLKPKQIGQPDLAKDVIEEAAKIVKETNEAMGKKIILQAFNSKHPGKLQQLFTKL
jgi:ATP-dependent Clp protease ATP-binding subunit ClpA